MNFRSLSAAIATVLLVGTLAVPAAATNGYFSHGYGIEYKGLAGTGAALYLSPMAAATNPGGMAFLGKQYDISLSIFNPNRRYTVTGEPSGAEGTFGLAPGTYESDSPVFYIPTFASNWLLNDDETMALGLAVYGNGGMNTDYPTATFDPGGMFGNTTPTGVNLMQLFVAPTFSVLIADSHGFGITPIFAWQSFEAKGLQAFGEMGFSSDPDNLTNNGSSSSVGYGVRVGYLAELLGYLSVGAAFQSKTYMDKFGDYAGLFAEQGGFDIPANWTVGIAMGFPGMGVAFDVQQILYSQVNSIANPLLPNLQEAQLGDDGGAGFGWEDMTIFKTGAWYMINSGWLFRGGYSYGGQPIPGSEVLFNILAPGVVEHHLSFGVSKDIMIDKEISFVVTRAFTGTVTGANPLEAPGQQTIELEMDQWEFGIGFSF
jgi:long-chain fatty acid transport protein